MCSLTPSHVQLVSLATIIALFVFIWNNTEPIKSGVNPQKWWLSWNWKQGDLFISYRNKMDDSFVCCYNNQNKKTKFDPVTSIF